MAEKLEVNYKPEIKIETAEKTLDENLVLMNIKSLLSSVGNLVESISKENKNELLQKQSEAIKAIEHELESIIKR